MRRSQGLSKVPPATARSPRRSSESPGLFAPDVEGKGLGVFAETPFEAGAEVLEFRGEVRDVESFTDLTHALQVGPRRFLSASNGIDDFVNHSCEPNCEVEIARGKIWIKSTRAIKKGEELLFSYSYDLEESKDYPCVCGTKKCVGSILDKYYWPVLAKLKKKKSLEICTKPMSL